MKSARIILRCVVGLIGTVHAAAVALQEDHEAEYQQARRDFDAVCAESDYLLAEADGAAADAASWLGLRRAEGPARVSNHQFLSSPPSAMTRRLGHQ